MFATGECRKDDADQPLRNNLPIVAATHRSGGDGAGNEAGTNRRRKREAAEVRKVERERQRVEKKRQKEMDKAVKKASC